MMKPGHPQLFGSVSTQVLTCRQSYIFFMFKVYGRTCTEELKFCELFKCIVPLVHCFSWTQASQRLLHRCPCRNTYWPKEQNNHNFHKLFYQTHQPQQIPDKVFKQWQHFLLLNSFGLREKHNYKGILPNVAINGPSWHAEDAISLLEWF